MKVRKDKDGQYHIEFKYIIVPNEFIVSETEFQRIKKAWISYECFKFAYELDKYLSNKDEN